MQDLSVDLPDGSASLAAMGEALGRADVSVEGGGMFGATGHFLVADSAAACFALRGFRVAIRDVLTVRLRQAVPGQLGLLARRMAEAGVRIEVQYSDHAGNLVLVVDDMARGRAVCEAWAR